MRLLIVAATDAEIAPLGSRVRDATILVTGVGMVATAAHTARALARASYDLALNVGICGSFDPSLQPPTVVHVVSDRISELGAEDGERFLPIERLDLPALHVFENPTPPGLLTLRALPAVRGITVNTVHGFAHSIAAVLERLRPQVETMEGAGFMCACALSGVPFAQVRAVSNMVTRRDREAWRVADAIQALADTVSRIVDEA
jgi:futalosine hydrolase